MTIVAARTGNDLSGSSACRVWLSVGVATCAGARASARQVVLGLLREAFTAGAGRVSFVIRATCQAARRRVTSRSASSDIRAQIGRE